jgi:hypothetical protein
METSERIFTMARNRHQKSSVKSPTPAPQTQAPKISPAAQKLVNQIASGGEDYVIKNLVQVMTGSDKLAREEEFIDLYMDGKKAAEASERWFEKYEKRLTAATKKGEEESFEVYEEMQAKLIDELVTPDFRTEVIERLQTLINRLMTSNHIKKLEMVLLLQPMLIMRGIPWSACGLIRTIYERTMEVTIQQFEDQKELLDELEKTLKEEGDEGVDIEKILESPEKFEEIGEKLLAGKPDLLQRLEEQADEMLDEFEEELVGGKVVLDLFTEAELAMPFVRLTAELGAPSLLESTSEIQERIYQTINKALIEMMTPERMQIMHQVAESTARAWFSQKQKWAPALDSELGWLEGDAYEENSFIYAVFLGQVKRANSEEDAPTKSKKRKHR